MPQPRRGIFRPRYIAPGDTRSPMLRLLQDCTDMYGLVAVNYHEQWRTLFKAKRQGLVDSDCRITDAGRRWLVTATRKDRGQPPLKQV